MSNHTHPLSLVRRLRPAVLLLLLVAMLAACGGDDTPAPEATAAAPAQEAPAEATTAPAGETAASPAPATIAPEPTPTVASPDTADGSDTAAPAAGACGNEYFPVVEGREVRYSNTVPGMGTSEFSQITSDVTESSFVVTSVVDESDAIVMSWECTVEGLLAPELSQLPGAEGLSIEYTEAEGITIPPADRFRLGESWTTHYVATATIGEEGEALMTMVETIDLANEVVAIEAISVPAGNYPNAVRVDTTGNISISMSVDGAAAPTNDVAMNFSSWYVAGVGLVRQEFNDFFGGEEGGIVTELVAVE